MICKSCHKTIPDFSNYCSFCGRRQTTGTRKPKRSPNGSGCAFQRPGQKTWTAQAIVAWRDPPPFDPANPENVKQRIPIKRTRGGFPTKAAALAYVPVLKAGGHLRPETAPNLQYYWKIYEKDDLKQLSPSKQTAYKIAWEKLSKLHDAQVDQLTVADLRGAVSASCPTYYPAKDCRTILGTLFKLAAADGYANKDLPSFIQLPTLRETEREAFNDIEQAALWKLYESGDLRAAPVLLMIYTGMMPGETFDLRVDMIDLENRQIVGAGKKTKVRKASPVILATNILPVVEDLIAHALPSGRLFKSSMDLWRAEYYAALEAAGCRRLPPYSCRHTTATALAITEGIAPQTVQKIMRWSTSRMLDRYAHPDRSDLRAAVDSIHVGSETVADDGSETVVAK